MMNAKQFFLGISLMALGLSLSGQMPTTSPLTCNPALTGRISLKAAVTADTVSLPFIDDFWYYDRSPVPDPQLWTDRNVFINNSYPVLPRSNGVATFDALDSEGKVYRGPYADTLTSVPIDLQATMTGVYLSFFYQPQGKGDAPEGDDRLILQFKTANDEWYEVWQAAGTTLQDFKPVLIPLSDADLYKGFRFRFLNTVSFGEDRFNVGKKGNVDMWQLDYVRLDQNRNEEDTAMLDVALIEPMRSLIKGYTAMPWSHFTKVASQKVESQIAVTYRNNDANGYMVNRVFDVTDLYHSRTTPVGNSGAENIDAGEVMTYRAEMLNPFVTTSTDSALFEVKGYIVTDDRDRKENDTVRFIQRFSNYFARDDGAPESGFGYEGINAQGFSIACRYEMFTPDTLRGVSIYFNSVLDNVTRSYFFRIAVWKDDNGRPGEQIYLSQQEYHPEQTDCFTLYPLDAPLFINKTFWIGWQQVSSGFLNVGYDLSLSDRGNVWYDSEGEWKADGHNGTLMIRPYAGTPIPLPTDAPEIAGTNGEWTVYPNPTSTFVEIEGEIAPGASYTLEIFDATGQIRYRQSFTGSRIDVSALPSGVYIMRLTNGAQTQLFTQRIVIRH